MDHRRIWGWVLRSTVVAIAGFALFGAFAMFAWLLVVLRPTMENRRPPARAPAPRPGPRTPTRPDYARAVVRVRRLFAQGRLPAAESRLRALLRAYPDNPELLGLLARDLFWRHRYADAIPVYRRALALRADPTLAAQLRDAEAAMTRGRAAAYARDGQPGRARALLERLFRSGPDYYDDGLALARVYAAQRHFRRAADVYGALAVRYPDDPEIAAARIRMLLAADESGATRRSLADLMPGVRACVARDLGDRQVRLYPDQLRLVAGSYGSSHGYPDDSFSGIELTQNLSVGSVALRALGVRRFGEYAHQYGATLYAPLVRAVWGYVSVDYSPEASFLPHTAFAGALYKGIGANEISLGYRRLDFAATGADIFFPGVIFSLSPALTLTTRLYWVPATRAYSILLMPAWQDARRDRLYLALTGGEASEQLGTAQGILRAPSAGVRLGGEWRMRTRLSVGAEALYEHRSGLYDRAGVSAFAAWWW